MPKEGAKYWYPRPQQTRISEVTTTNKFGALEGENKEEPHKESDFGRKEEKKGNQVEEQVHGTTQYEERSNKKEVNNTQNTSIEKDDAQSAIKDMLNLSDELEQSVKKMNDKEKEADGENEKEIEKKADTREHPDVGDSQIRETCNSQTHHVTIPPPKIDKLSEQERKEIQEREKDENMEINIDNIG
ncbi:uncharacterized protein LOC125843166 [Solanum stenotomum]|uniref:uncharacterized protein LOC125843166 n=1 Tax=Solanum stenotomum TaxID=172797 RepID=UPI0020D1EC55|nr:uncharacterized protein LOC125843166 [Solanum stenotomum]